jgi:antitoxin ParD1/3/4
MKPAMKSSTASINISLPSDQRQFVKRRVTKGGYTTVSEYFRDLVRQDEERETEARLESFLLEAAESGEPTPMTAKDWEDIRNEVKRRAQRRRRAKPKK